MANEIKAQTTALITWPWATVRVQRIRVRGQVNQHKSTGVGNGINNIFTEGNTEIEFAFSGVMITNTFDITTRSGTIKIDFVNDGAYLLEAPVNLESWVIEGDFLRMGPWRIAGTCKVNGAIIRNGVTVT